MHCLRTGPAAAGWLARGAPGLQGAHLLQHLLGRRVSLGPVLLELVRLQLAQRLLLCQLLGKGLALLLAQLLPRRCQLLLPLRRVALQQLLQLGLLLLAGGELALQLLAAGLLC
jgi:hypothetical protein